MNGALGQSVLVHAGPVCLHQPVSATILHQPTVDVTASGRDDDTVFAIYKLVLTRRLVLIAKL